MSKLVIGITGPSVHTPAVREMVSKYFDAIPLDINQNGDDIDQIASLCHHFILAGGNDIYPLSLEHERRELCPGNNYSKFDRARDRREFRLIDLALKQNKKVLGICRGHQMLLSHAGLYLIPDISSYTDVCHNPSGVEVNDEPIHYLDSVGNGDDFVKDNEAVNSFHHQAILMSPKDAYEVGIEVLATAPTIWKTNKNIGQNIIELARRQFNKDGKHHMPDFISCQWHPELSWQDNEPSARVLEYFKKMIS
jgi:gamma-glutamyl-gamma-aminobutyrate hydrolase PuuD